MASPRSNCAKLAQLESGWEVGGKKGDLGDCEWLKPLGVGDEVSLADGDREGEILPVMGGVHIRGPVPMEQARIGRGIWARALPGLASARFLYCANCSNSQRQAITFSTRSKGR